VSNIEDKFTTLPLPISHLSLVSLFYSVWQCTSSFLLYMCRSISQLYFSLNYCYNFLLFFNQENNKERNQCYLICFCNWSKIKIDKGAVKYLSWKKNDANLFAVKYLIKTFFTKEQLWYFKIE
jgi:hypothetical protein